MADDKHYVPGDFYRIDDRSGFKVRAKRTEKEWTGLIVAENLWEPRQPQDFVTGIPDNQTVPDPRPRQTNQFISSTGNASFMVYGDMPFKTFLVQNTLAYNTGINSASDYTNPNGTAEFTCYSGTIDPIIVADVEQNQ